MITRAISFGSITAILASLSHWLGFDRLVEFLALEFLDGCELGFRGANCFWQGLAVELGLGLDEG